MTGFAAIDPDASAFVKRALRCPSCVCAFDGELRCPGCGRRTRADDVALDVVGDECPPASLGERAMRSSWLARVYESWWRPLAFRLTAGPRMPSAEVEASLVLSKLKGTLGPWLDLSCGPGNFTRRLAAGGGSRPIVAADLSRAMLERVRERAPSAVRVRADACAIPFADGAFGAVINLAALDLYPDPARAVAESARVLASGGRWVASTFVAPRRSAHVAWATGVRTPTEGELASYARDAGLVGLDFVRFGRYVVAWASKE